MSGYSGKFVSEMDKTVLSMEPTVGLVNDYISHSVLTFVSDFLN